MAGRPKGTRKTGGRQKGTPNRVTRDIREVAQRMVSDPVYLRRLRARLREGTAGPVEPLLFAYAYGRPGPEGAVPIERFSEVFVATFRAFSELFEKVMSLEDDRERYRAWDVGVRLGIRRRIRPMLLAVDGVEDDTPQEEPVLHIVNGPPPDRPPEVIEL